MKRRFCFGALLRGLRNVTFAAFALSAFSQQQNVVVQPDISMNFGPLTGTGAVQFLQSTETFGIRYWRYTYQSTGFSALSIVLQSAPDSAGAPGVWVTMPGTVTAGTNPQTATQGGLTSITVAANTNNPWVRINLTSVTGSGTILGRVMGYRINPDGGSGCTSPCIVIGPDAPGAPSTQAPVQVAGNDGTDVRAIRTDPNGNTQVVGPTAQGSPSTTPPIQIAELDGNGNLLIPTLGTLSAAVSLTSSGLTQVIALSGGKSIRIAHFSIAFASGVDFQLEYGTGAACGTGTTALTGVYKNITTYAYDAPAGAPLPIPAGNALCVNLGASVTGGGLVQYGLF
jgi:hypothetical protein